MDGQLLEMLKTYLEPSLEPTHEWTESEENQLSVLLQFSGQKILNQRYPFSDEVPSEVPGRYRTLQVRIAAELYSKIGAEGQTTHSENGISRAWESADVAQGLLSEVIPYLGVVGG